MSRSVIWFATCKVIVTVGAHRSKYGSIHHIFWTADPFATKLGFIIHYHKPECLTEWNWIVVFKSRPQQNVRMSVNVCLDNIFWIVVPFITKLGIVMHDYSQICFQKDWFAWLQAAKPLCNQTWYVDALSWATGHARRLVCCQGHSAAHIIKYDCFYQIYWTADLFAARFNWMVHCHKLRCLV